MMMFGFGWIMMLLVVGLPILLAIILIAGAAGFLQNRGQRVVSVSNQPNVYQPTADPIPPAIQAVRYCSHCGAGLQSDWTHCPKCGAPIQ